MNSRTRMAAFVLVVIICAAQDSPTRPPKSPKPVFALFQNFFDPVIVIDPICLLNGNGVIPFPDPETSPRTQALLKKYLRSGSRYTLVYGGGDMGSVVLGPHGEVDLHSRVRIHGRTMGLAVDPAFVVTKGGSRREPTSNERARATLLAKSLFRAHGAKPSAFSRLEFSQINVLPLNNVNLQIVASVAITRPDKMGAECTAFFIGRESSPGMDVLWYQHPKNDNEIEELYLLDVLDTDGDGVKELVTMRIYYEAIRFEIYKYSNGGWKNVFSTRIQQEF